MKKIISQKNSSAVYQKARVVNVMKQKVNLNSVEKKKINDTSLKQEKFASDKDEIITEIKEGNSKILSAIQDLRNDIQNGFNSINQSLKKLIELQKKSSSNTNSSSCYILNSLNKKIKINNDDSDIFSKKNNIIYYK